MAPNVSTRKTMKRGGTLPTVTFDSDAIASRLRLDALNDFYRGLCNIQSLTGSQKTIKFKGQFWRFGEIVAGRTVRSPAIIVAPSKTRNDDHFSIRTNLKGTTRAIFDEAPVRIIPGAVHLHDRRRLVRSTHGQVETVTIGVPYAAVGYDPSRQAAHRALRFDTPLGRILRTNIETMLEVLPRAGRDEGRVMAESFTALLRGIVTSDQRDESVRSQFERSREAALKQFIDENLRNPELTIERICRAIGVSRSTLFRIFASDGGVARYMLRRRLAGALMELAQSAPRRGLVNAVALRWAFHDNALFARQFRAQFGFPPSDAIGSLGLAPGAGGAASSTVGAASGTDITPIASLIA